MSDPSVVRLADNTLLLVQELRNSTLQFGRNVEALRTSVEATNTLRREIHDGNAEHERVMRSIDFELKQMNKLLGVISKDVDDVERVTREATGAHALAAYGDTKAGLLKTFGEMPRFTQGLLTVLASVIALGGWAHWIVSALVK